MAARVFVYERAGAVVVDRDRVLLVSMAPPGEPRWWHFPGGGIEPGETPAEAAIRELFEETGLRATGARETLRAGIHGGQHHYFLMTCEDLLIGDVTGPELEYAADADFRAEWVPIADLVSMPVWPRCVAEHVAAGRHAAVDVPWVEDDRQSGDGLPGGMPTPGLRVSARAVIISGGRVAAIERRRDGESWFTLPGGGVETGESVEQAVVREVREELGLRVEPAAKLAVVVLRRDDLTSLQTYVACHIVGGDFATGDGEEFSAARRATRGTYRPVWLDVAEVPATLRPTWLRDRLPAWMEDSPDRPERFCEIHDGGPDGFHVG